MTVVIIPRSHDLKTWPVHFQAVRDGAKRAEFRKNDRGFAVDDVLILREWVPDGEDSHYTGRYVVAVVKHITDNAPGNAVGIPAGYVMLSIDVVAISDTYNVDYPRR